MRGRNSIAGMIFLSLLLTASVHGEGPLKHAGSQVTAITPNHLAGSAGGRVVTAEDLKPLAGVTVVLTNVATGIVYRAQTDAGGRYRRDDVLAGQYNVSVATPDFKMVAPVQITVVAGGSVQGNVVILRETSASQGREPPGHHHSKVVASPPPSTLPDRSSAGLARGAPTAGGGAMAGTQPATQPLQHVTAPGTSVEPPAPRHEPEKPQRAMGQILPSIPGDVRLNRPVTGTISIGGSGAPLLVQSPGQAGELGHLQVSRNMWVELTSPDPEAFDIAPGAGSAQNPRLVEPGKTTTWSWTITPKKLGTQQLHVEAYTMDGEDAASRLSQYDKYDQRVNVKVQTLAEYLQTGLTYVLDNPIASLKYLLPGGGGAVILGGLLAWWRRRSQASGSNVTSSKD